MSTPVADHVLKQLQWRYATQQFDGARKISSWEWDALEDALILTPSSYGAQPWKFIVVTDQDTKDRLVPFSWGQKQVADCSHLLVFAIRTNIDENHIDSYIKRIAEIRGNVPETHEKLRNAMINDVVVGPRSKWVDEWATRQVYIALGNFMTSAAILGIDTCPMEGFLPEKYNEVLGLTELHLSSVVACPAGYRLETDKYASLPKVRFRKEDLIVRI